MTYKELEKLYKQQMENPDETTLGIEKEWNNYVNDNNKWRQSSNR